ncbi:MAG: NAD-dependent epimerase/dehydratase family protein [Acidobacteriota bacterium]|nr:NAD-dependent epimerase/dehydratase family protein [Acidobacteriota bacterium]
MRQAVVLITGAAGEIGHALITRIAEQKAEILTLDLQALPPALEERVTQHFVGSILDDEVLDRILARYEVDTVFHLAALLSTRSEFTPLTAHQVNVEGTIRLLRFAQAQGLSHGRTVRFFYPSSIAAYGLPDLAAKAAAGAVREEDWGRPITMYGINKLYCEQLGRYFQWHYKQLDAEPQARRIDFRGIRFPGLISAETVPSGGTSDFVPEMIHAAAQGRPYACFVREDARIPFMTMPDAVDAIFALMGADAARLRKNVYNIAAFNPSAGEVSEIVTRHFPAAEIRFEPDLKRQAIVDSWPAAVDDGAAREDWGFDPRHDLETAFEAYLLPRIRQRYS